MSIEQQGARRKRVMDTTPSDARRAVADVVRGLQPLRERIAVATARAERKLSTKERTELRQDCEQIAIACQRARVELLEKLMDAPRQVIAHSRVADVEKALDNLEQATNEALHRLRALN